MIKTIDRYLPVYQYHEMHSIIVHAPCADVFKAALQYKMEDDTFIRKAIFLRELPEKFLQILSVRKTAKNKPFGLDSFTLLECVENKDILYGLIGKFWSFNYGLITIKDNIEYLQFNESGIPKLIFSINMNSLNNENTELVTQTRIFCPDRQSYYKFMPYWYLIRLVSGIIRKRMLKTIKKEAHKEFKIANTLL